MWWWWWWLWWPEFFIAFLYFLPYYTAVVTEYIFTRFLMMITTILYSYWVLIFFLFFFLALVTLNLFFYPHLSWPLIFPRYTWHFYTWTPSFRTPSIRLLHFLPVQCVPLCSTSSGDFFSASFFFSFIEPSDFILHSWFLLLFIFSSHVFYPLTFSRSAMLPLLNYILF